MSLKDGSAENNFWDAQAHLWLGDNWGQLALGRADNPSAEGVNTWELTSDANYSVVSVFRAPSAVADQAHPEVCATAANHTLCPSASDDDL